MRTAVGFLLLASVLPVTAQSSPPIDSAAYLSFFREAILHDAEHIVTKINGQSTDLISPSVQDAMGITDREAKVLIPGRETRVRRSDNPD